MFNRPHTHEITDSPYALFLASTLGVAEELGELCQAYLKRLTAREAFLRARVRQSA